MTITRDIMEYLSTALSLPYTGLDQDWDLEMADPKRIEEFIKFYKETKLKDDHKSALMALIIASYNDFLNERNIDVDSKWNEIESLLNSKKFIFTNILEYWSLEKEMFDVFKVTPLVRKINKN